MTDPALSKDATLRLDGSTCKECRGTVVAEPVEVDEPARLRCRDCGWRKLL